MASSISDYPWFRVVEGDEIQQGDIFEACPVFLPPPDLDITSNENVPREVVFTWKARDIVVLSQSCDLANDKLEDVLLVAVWNRSELTQGHLASDKGMEEARRGLLPAFHVIAASDLPGYEREVRVVDFRNVYSLPVPFMRKRAVLKRLRLLPPYREQLSQSFARFFMRVGLPVDIPAFKSKRT